MENKEKTTALVVGRGFNYADPVQFENIQRTCQIFTHSDLVPSMYQESKGNSAKKATANCMIALDMANRIGASPLMVMQNLYIVNGHPSWSSQFLIATVNTCGRFEPLKFKFNKDRTECTAYTTAKGSEEVLEGTTITMKMAEDEGWTKKAGSKWRTMPQQMLIYRAAAFWIRAYAPELSMGIRTAEENYEVEEAEVVTENISEVEKEIEENANQEEIAMEEEQPQEKVDTETGEVLEDETPILEPEY